MGRPNFRSSPIDSRRLTMPAHQVARQTPGERRRIHGKLRELDGSRHWTWPEWLVLIAGTALIFGAYIWAAGELPL